MIIGASRAVGHATSAASSQREVPNWVWDLYKKLEGSTPGVSKGELANHLSGYMKGKSVESQKEADKLATTSQVLAVSSIYRNMQSDMENDPVNNTQKVTANSNDFADRIYKRRGDNITDINVFWSAITGI